MKLFDTDIVTEFSIVSPAVYEEPAKTPLPIPGVRDGARYNSHLPDTASVSSTQLAKTIIKLTNIIKMCEAAH